MRILNSIRSTYTPSNVGTSFVCGELHSLTSISVIRSTYTPSHVGTSFVCAELHTLTSISVVELSPNSSIFSLTTTSDVLGNEGQHDLSFVDITFFIIANGLDLNPFSLDHFPSSTISVKEMKATRMKISCSLSSVLKNG